MVDDQNIDAGSETSGDTADTDTASTDQNADVQDAGGAADAEKESDETSGEQAADPDASRTGFADTGLKPGDACTCPDGRAGTVHRFDAGLICLPNQG